VNDSLANCSCFGSTVFNLGRNELSPEPWVAGLYIGRYWACFNFLLVGKEFKTPCLSVGSSRPE
jgi:hypothetical protein